jgi:basic membrane protein A and related proteins
MRRALKMAVVAGLMVGSTLLAAGCGSDDEGAATSGSGAGRSDVQVALVLDGPLEDGGWNSLWQQAGEKLKAALPGVEVKYVPKVSPGAQLQRTLRTLATQGVDLIVGTGGGMDADILKVAPDFPDTKFAAALAAETADNMASIDAAIEQGRYLDGIVAGSMTESGVVGDVGGFPLPFELRAVNGMTIGARSVNPDVVVQVLHINSWYDPAKERQAAEALVDRDADVLAMALHTPAVPAVAKANGAGVIGYAVSRKDSIPENWLSAFTFDWSVYLISAAKAIEAGTWKPERFYGDLADGTMKMAPFGDSVPADVIKKVEQAREQLASGKLQVFSGPLKSNTGETVVPDGEVLDTPEELIPCCEWLVEGASGK